MSIYCLIICLCKKDFFTINIPFQSKFFIPSKFINYFLWYRYMISISYWVDLYGAKNIIEIFFHTRKTLWSFLYREKNFCNSLISKGRSGSFIA